MQLLLPVRYKCFTSYIISINIRDMRNEQIKGVEVELVEKLTDRMREVDDQIRNDAFSDLLNLAESEKEEMDDMYKVREWRYLFAKVGGQYVGRVVLDRRE